MYFNYITTVEDDMAISKKEKVPMLRIFYKKCYDPKFTYVFVFKHKKITFSSLLPSSVSINSKHASYVNAHIFVSFKHSYPCGTKHYKVLMDEYPKVVNVFLSLKKPYQVRLFCMIIIKCTCTYD